MTNTGKSPNRLSTKPGASERPGQTTPLWRAPRGLLLGVGAIVLVLVSAGSLFAQSDPSAEATPRVTIEPTSVDLGELIKGTPGIAEYEIRNLGAAPLRILKVNPG
jgi:hypothetical protein